MTTKFLALISVIGLASICVVQAQTPTPTGSPAASPSPAKHRTHKKAEAKAKSETAASPTASASPHKSTLGDFFKPRTSASAGPAAASPAPAKSASAEAATNPPAAGGGHGLVWVNTESHVYHREGSRFYGTTKKGKYVTEAEAIKSGNKAAPKGQ
jgi:hypothetical protein